MVSKVHVAATINGEPVEFLCEPRQSLLEVLRDELKLTGSKEGCNNGNCGACSVILDGLLVDACIVLGAEIDGCTVETIEGLMGPEGSASATAVVSGTMPRLQCGICTPGFIIAGKALLDKNPQATEGNIRHWCAGNLCRCTGYDKIVRAIMEAEPQLEVKK